MEKVKKLFYEKGSKTPNKSEVLGIQLRCREHDWQRTIHITDGIGCSVCYGGIKNK